MTENQNCLDISDGESESYYSVFSPNDVPFSRDNRFHSISSTDSEKTILSDNDSEMSVISVYSMDSEESSDLATIRSLSLSSIDSKLSKISVPDLNGTEDSLRLYYSSDSSLSSDIEDFEWDSSDTYGTPTESSHSPHHSQWCSTSFSSVANQTSLSSWSEQLPVFNMYSEISSESEFEICKLSADLSPSLRSSDCETQIDTHLFETPKLKLKTSSLKDIKREEEESDDSDYSEFEDKTQTMEPFPEK